MDPIPAPTIGRIVHVFNRASSDSGDKPEAAIVTSVHEDDYTINATVFNAFGTPCSQTSIPHVSEPADATLHWDWPARA